MKKKTFLSIIAMVLAVAVFVPGSILPQYCAERTASNSIDDKTSIVSFTASFYDQYYDFYNSIDGLGFWDDGVRYGINDPVISATLCRMAQDCVISAVPNGTKDFEECFISANGGSKDKTCKKYGILNPDDLITMQVVTSSFYKSNTPGIQICNPKSYYRNYDTFFITKETIMGLKNEKLYCGFASAYIEGHFVYAMVLSKTLPNIDLSVVKTGTAPKKYSAYLLNKKITRIEDSSSLPRVLKAGKSYQLKGLTARISRSWVDRWEETNYDSLPQYMQLKKIKLKSSNPSVATVSASGKIVARRPGQTKIYLDNKFEVCVRILTVK